MKNEPKTRVDSRINFLKEVSRYLPKNPVCAELGVLGGKFSAHILKIIKPKVLHLIDPWEVGYELLANNYIIL